MWWWKRVPNNKWDKATKSLCDEADECSALRSSSVLPLNVMAVGFVLLLSLLLPSPRPSLGVSPPCPAGCRCYSLTVECGSTDLRDIPRLIPPSTQVVPFSACHRLLFISSRGNTFTIMFYYSPFLFSDHLPPGQCDQSDSPSGPNAAEAPSLSVSAGNKLTNLTPLTFWLKG